MTSRELDEIRPERRRHAWYRRRDVLFIAVVAALALAWEGYGRITGPSRISDELHTTLERNPPSVDLLVTAKFPPERFHSNVYNTIGVQRGTQGATTLLVRVTPSNVRWLSRQYWIDRIDIAPDEQTGR